MKYLQSSFTIERPAQVFGCEACIYGPKHGYEHTRGEGCELAALGNVLTTFDRVKAPRQSSLMRIFKGC